MEYKVVTHQATIDSSSGNGEEELNKRVASRVENGWTPKGGVSISTFLDNDGSLVRTYAQALVKQE